MIEGQAGGDDVVDGVRRLINEEKWILLAGTKLAHKAEEQGDLQKTLRGKKYTLGGLSVCSPRTMTYKLAAKWRKDQGWISFF